MPPARRFSGKQKHEIVTLPAKQTTQKSISPQKRTSSGRSVAMMDIGRPQTSSPADFSMETALNALNSVASPDKSAHTLVHGLGTGMSGAVLTLLRADTVRDEIKQSDLFDAMIKTPQLEKKARISHLGQQKSNGPDTFTELWLDPLQPPMLLSVPSSVSWLPPLSDWVSSPEDSPVSSQRSVEIRCSNVEVSLTDIERRALILMRRRKAAEERAQQLKELTGESKGAVTLLNAPRMGRIGAVVASLSGGESSVTALEEHVRHLAEARRALREKPTEAKSSDERWLSYTKRDLLQDNQEEHWVSVLRCRCESNVDTKAARAALISTASQEGLGGICWRSNDNVFLVIEGSYLSVSRALRKHISQPLCGSSSFIPILFARYPVVTKMKDGKPCFSDATEGWAPGKVKAFLSDMNLRFLSLLGD